MLFFLQYKNHNPHSSDVLNTSAEPILRAFPLAEHATTDAVCEACEEKRIS